MAAAFIWPPTLPQSQFLELQYQIQGGAVIRTGTDSGPAFTRPRYTSAPKNVQVPIVFSNEQFATFNTFYETSLVMGSLAFGWEDPRDDSLVDFRFLDYPNFTMGAGANGRIWQGTMQLEMLVT